MAETASSPPLDDVAAARAAVTCLLRMASASRAHQPVPEEAVQGFKDHLREPLQAQLSVVLEFQRKAIHYAGHEIAGADLISRGVSEVLYETGLRSLQIEPEASDEELERLAMLLSTDWSATAAFDLDFEATSWKLGFRAVHLDIAAQGLDHDGDLAGLEDSELVPRLLRLLGPELSEAGGEPLKLEVATVLRSLRRADHDEAMRREVDLDQPALAQVRRKLREVHEDTDATVDDIGMVIFESLRNDPSGMGAGACARRLVHHCCALLSNGAPREAVTLVRRTMMLLQGPPFHEFPHAAVLAGELRALIDEDGRKAIEIGCRAPGASPEDWTGPLFTLAQLAGPRQLGALLELSAVLPDRVRRQAIADALVLLVDRHGLSWRQVLGESHGSQTTVVLLALALRPDSTLAEQILARLSSERSDVREAALVALRAHQSPRIRELVRRAIADDALEVRLEALRYLAVYRDRQFAPKLLDRATTLAHPEPGEMLALCKAFAVITRTEGVSHLEALANGARASRHPDVVEASLRALRACGSPGMQALDRIGRRHPELRDTIRRVEVAP